MTREAGGAITLLTGAITLRLALTGDYKRYVRPGMGPLLAIAGVILAAVGLAVVVAALQRRPAGAPHHDGHHDHDRGDSPEPDDGHEAGEDDHEPERVGWLVLAPVLAVLLVAPPALGAFAVDRVSPVQVETGALFEPLPASAEPREMSLLEFAQRAADRNGASFAGASVALTGFVAGTADGGFELARYSIACCAADAAVAVTLVETDGPPPRRDEWVRVTGTFRSGTDGARGSGDAGPDGPPVLVATTVQPVPTPDDPYE